MAPRIHQYIERLAQARLEVFDETTRKRAAPSEPTDGLDQAKRAKLAAQIPETKPSPQVHIPPLPPGPVSVTQLFTLTPDRALMSFDVTQLPAMLVIQMLLPALYHVNPNVLNQAVEVSCSLLTSVSY